MTRPGPTAAPGPMSKPGDPAERASAEVERLLGQLRAGPDPRAAGAAEELARCLVGLYGDGLRRIVAAVGPDRTRELCADPLVASLLLVHDLHPVDPETRIRQALGEARARIGAVTYLGVDAGGVVHLRLPAGGSLCRSSSARAQVEQIVQRAAPDVAGVDVQVPPPAPALMQITRRPSPDRP